MIIEYSASNIKPLKKGQKILIDEDCKPQFDAMNDVLIAHSMIFWVTSSGRKDTNVKGSIVTPAKKGNHLVYQALDGNLQHMVTKEWFNSDKMGDGTGIDELCCQDIVKKTGLRWGARFSCSDPVHFDTGLNIKNSALWRKKYNEIHHI